MSSIVINKNNFWKYSSKSLQSIIVENLVINDEFVIICINNIFSKLNPFELKKIIINNKITGRELNLDKFTNLEYLELGEKFNCEQPINLKSNLNLKGLKILSWNYNYPLDLSSNINLEKLEFGDFGIFNHPLDFSVNTKLISLKLPSCFSQDLYLMNCENLKRFIIDKNYKSLVHIQYKNLDEFTIIGIDKIDENTPIIKNDFNDDILYPQNKKRKLNEKSFDYYLYQSIQNASNKFGKAINPVILTKRLINLQKLRDQGKLDEYLNSLTQEEIDIFY